MSLPPAAALGTDVKGRDAIIVYPKGRDKTGVEVPLKKTSNGYNGKRLIPYSELEKLTDERTKIEVSISTTTTNTRMASTRS